MKPGSVEEKIAKAVGSRCRKLREAKSLTLDDMESVGLGSRHYFRVENGRKSATLWTYLRIARALEVTISDLLQGIELPSKWSP